MSADRSETLSRGINLDEDEFFAEQGNYGVPSRFLMGSVADKRLTKRISKWSETQWSISPLEAQVRRVCGGVKINYADVTRLGVDRWLAMLGAFERSKGPCIVIDSGTAFTLDILNEDGMHLGGYILPGLWLMKESLTCKTGIRLEAKTLEPCLDLGNSTDEAVVNGGLAALVALIEKKMEELSKSGCDPKVYLTGGDADFFVRQMDFPALELDMDLVLDGLRIACVALGDSR
tara:strand:- start:83 stop:781 length:699 start_codon:yes stop_codon:yes gene_type:complete